MSLSLDYTKISTWENIDIQTACLRISCESENNYNQGAIYICVEVFTRMQEDKNQRAQFFLNCETLGLHGWKVHGAFKYHCHEDYPSFIQAVLKSEASMMKTIRKKEKEMSQT